MKKLIYVLSLALMLCLLPCTSALAENYELTTGGSSKATATAIRVDREYAAQLVGSEVLYFKFTTPNKKGFYDFYAKNINISTHSWAGDSQVQFDLIDAVDEIFVKHYAAIGGERSANLELDRNTTYYVKVYNRSPNDTPGNFKIKVSFREDKEGDRLGNAVSKRIGEKVNASLDGKDDIDYFKIKTGAYKEYDFDCKNINISTHSWAGDSQFRVSICDAREEVLADYRLTYGSDNKRDGVTPLVTLNPNTVYYIRIYNPQEGIGNYTFTMSHHRNSISQAAVQVKNTYTYTGKAITPGVKVVYGSTVLKKGKDYSVAYSNNKKPGIATAKITGIGAYKGSYKATFKIRPVQAKIQKLSVKKRKITVKIAQDKNASGYEIQYAANSSFKSAKKISVNGNKAVTKQTPSLKASTKYFVRVRSYKKVGSQKITSVWSAPKSIRTKK